MKINVLLRAGVLLTLAVAASTVPTQAQLTTIHSFTGTNGDGEYPFPYARLPSDNNGALYGTTAGGGTNNNGTVYQLVPQSGGGWTENVLYEFQGGVPTEGNPAWAWYSIRWETCMAQRNSAETRKRAAAGAARFLNCRRRAAKAGNGRTP
jgi:uncharacterized repeat protein (TIGR03803 family)